MSSIALTVTQPCPVSSNYRKPHRELVNSFAPRPE